MHLPHMIRSSSIMHECETACLPSSMQTCLLLLLFILELYWQRQGFQQRCFDPFPCCAVSGKSDLCNKRGTFIYDMVACRELILVSEADGSDVTALLPDAREPVPQDPATIDALSRKLSRMLGKGGELPVDATGLPHDIQSCNNAVTLLHALRFVPHTSCLSVMAACAPPMTSHLQAQTVHACMVHSMHIACACCRSTHRREHCQVLPGCSRRRPERSNHFVRTRCGMGAEEQGEASCTWALTETQQDTCCARNIQSGTLLSCKSPHRTSLSAVCTAGQLIALLSLFFC